MNLKDALKRVVKICPKSKELSLFRSVRCMPGDENSPSRVFATDGVCSITASVDEPLPDVLLTSGPIAAAIKDKGKLAFRDLGDGNVELYREGIAYKVPKVDTCAYFPGPPEAPTAYRKVDAWWLVQKVLHAAASVKAKVTLSSIHFTPNYVEAFDQVRLSRVAMAVPWDGLVPARLFKSWPRGSVLAAFTEHHAFFKIMDEVRIANLGTVAYPNTDKLISATHTGGSVIAELEELQSVVQQALEVSPINLVMLTMKPGAVYVQACDTTGALDSYVGEMQVSSYGELGGSVTVDGKLLLVALKQAETPTVRLDYGEVVDPLRIVAGHFTECLWQRYWDN